MALIVQKFGGTSLANVQCIENAAKKIMKTRTQGHDVVVVASAMSGDTDRLVGLAKNIQAKPDPREYSVLVSTGEQAAVALLTMALLNAGCKARSYTGGQVKILTEGEFNQGKIKHIDTKNILKDLKAGTVVVLAGFQGVDEQGNITTIGRGGSDTTAVAMAAALNASECQIYTDVEGVYTADPNIVTEARLIDHVSFDEMVELASLGAKVLQHRAVEFAGKYKVPVRVLSSFEEGPGTLVTVNHDPMEKPIVSGITYNRNEAKFTISGIPDDVDLAYKVLGPVSQANIRVDMIVQNGVGQGVADLTFTVGRDDYHRTLEILDKLATDLGAKEIISDNKVGKLSIVGVGMGSHSGIASKMFQSLSKEGIKIQNISTSEIKISVVIEEKYLELGVRTLHSAFDLDKNPAEEGVIGKK